MLATVALSLISPMLSLTKPPMSAPMTRINMSRIFSNIKSRTKLISSKDFRSLHLKMRVVRTDQRYQTMIMIQRLMTMLKRVIN